jgi:hypothetical protein
LFSPANNSNWKVLEAGPDKHDSHEEKQCVPSSSCFKPPAGVLPPWSAIGQHMRLSSPLPTISSMTRHSISHRLASQPTD